MITLQEYKPKEGKGKRYFITIYKDRAEVFDKVEGRDIETATFKSMSLNLKKTKNYFYKKYGVSAVKFKVVDDYRYTPTIEMESDNVITTDIHIENTISQKESRKEHIDYYVPVHVKRRRDVHAYIDKFRIPVVPVFEYKKEDNKLIVLLVGERLDGEHKIVIDLAGISTYLINGKTVQKGLLENIFNPKIKK